MIFSAVEFIFLFLPFVLLAYYFLILLNQKLLAKIGLVAASLFFYAYWKVDYLLIILLSIGFNFVLSKYIAQAIGRKKKLLLQLGIVTNIGLLFYFKYLVFFANDVLSLLGGEFRVENILLPLAISFFTFQQVAYLVDRYKGQSLDDNLIDYCLFVTFFPQLIAGPIVHHKEMMPQFADSQNQRVNWDNLLLGLFVFSIGLFKKVVIADTLADWVDAGYSGYVLLTSLDAWMLSLSYTFQLYYDFSGYADMAIGIALMFNVKLPLNFMSPYRATDIQDFWRRWHMTLSRWLRDYVYIPLGGNKISKIITLRNVFLTAFVSGIWHGAGWTFMLWGALHGLAMLFHRLWKDAGFSLNNKLAWFMTFMFINLTWVFFRSENLTQATTVLAKMFNLVELKSNLAALNLVGVMKENVFWLLELPVKNEFTSFTNLTFLLLGLLIVERLKSGEKKLFVNVVISRWHVLTPFLMTISFWFICVETVEKFIYFNF